MSQMPYFSVFFVNRPQRKSVQLLQKIKMLKNKHLQKIFTKLCTQGKCVHTYR